MRHVASGPNKSCFSNEVAVLSRSDLLNEFAQRTGSSNGFISFSVVGLDFAINIACIQVDQLLRTVWLPLPEPTRMKPHARGVNGGGGCDMCALAGGGYPRGAGCLCNLDMKYNSRMPSSLRHAHGFVMGLWNEKTGNCWSMQVEEIDGKWVIPEKLKVI